METSILAKVEALELTYPFTEDELKHAFRSLAFKRHPDVGGSKEDFIKLKEAYDTLLPMCLTEELSGDRLKTAEGDLLSGLGKGLPSTINGTRCKVCFGTGFYGRYHTEHLAKVVCKQCGGSGFVRRSARVVLADFFFGMRICPSCFGSGGEFETIRVRVTHTCSKCKGTGETEIFNPALPKNRTTTSQKNEDKRPKKQYCSCGALMRDGYCWRCKGGEE